MDKLLLENGDFILQETGYLILLNDFIDIQNVVTRLTQCLALHKIK